MAEGYCPVAPPQLARPRGALAHENPRDNPARAKERREKQSQKRIGRSPHELNRPRHGSTLQGNVREHEYARLGHLVHRVTESLSAEARILAPPVGHLIGAEG